MRLGKWLSEDPIGFAAGDTNITRYVANRVLSMVDRDGLELMLGTYGAGRGEEYKPVYDAAGNGLMFGEKPGSFVHEPGPDDPLKGEGPDIPKDGALPPEERKERDEREFQENSTTYVMGADGRYTRPNKMPPNNTPLQNMGPAFLDGTQSVLDVAGFAGPLGPAADFTNGLIDLAKGDLASAGINFLAMIPIWGDGLKAGKMAKKGFAAAKFGDEAIEGSKKLSKIEKETKIEIIGDGEFTKITEVRPGKGPGQSRAEYVTIKNADGKTIKTYKDSYDRANVFQHRKPLTGGPEGRPPGPATPNVKPPDG